MTAEEEGLYYQLKKFYKKAGPKKVVQFVVAGATSYYVSTTLARLSGTALWVPAEWRDSVDILISTFGATVFVAARAWVEIHELSHSGRSENKKLNEKKRSLYILKRSVGCLLTSIVFLGAFMWLRSECVVAFDPRDWLARQDTRNLRDYVDDQKLQEGGLTDTSRPSARSTSMPSQQYIQEQRDLAHAQLYSEKPNSTPNPKLNPAFRLYKPEFVDVRNEKVYLPYFLPKELTDYIAQTASTRDGVDGITYMLAHEADHLFDMIEKNAHWQTAVTDWAFLALDVFIIFFFAVGSAVSFEIPAVIGEFLSRV